MANQLTIEALLKFAKEWSTKPIGDLNSFQISSVQLLNAIKEMDSNVTGSVSLEEKLGIDSKFLTICGGGCF